ncbi:hypothetical protein [Mesorhizobium shangrilense]|uniref:Uncharacterized protein n=1 Tax=Mesorhizobium shangrilense TaxID=460060 RepID=A0ABV2DPB9_9HYPH
MAGILGYFFGASGEIDVDMETSGGKKRKGEAGLPDTTRRRKGVFVAAVMAGA